VTALSKADQVYLLPIYAAREENTFGVTSEQLAEKLNLAGVPTEVLQTNGGAAEAVRTDTPQGGVVLVMGAGDVTEVAFLLTN
jgi:UDP-N-acetylmuramate--alanine ligase